MARITEASPFLNVRRPSLVGLTVAGQESAIIMRCCNQGVQEFGRRGAFLGFFIRLRISIISCVALLCGVILSRAEGRNRHRRRFYDYFYMSVD